ncbi:hypothetical protein [Hoeflea sp.]|uniref:hypothetical protein n=1 Tax=Hoeflea sp. TaxID=1940281 RepID=UPI003B52F1BB
MGYRIVLMMFCATALSACSTTSTPTNPLQKRWNGKEAGAFFAAYGPPRSDRSAGGGTTVYNWRGGFVRGRSCAVELTVTRDYTIKTIRATSDRIDPNGGPSHCETVLDADS